MKKRVISAVLAATTLCGLSGCGMQRRSAVSENGDMQLIDFNQYEACDDIPSWEGEQIELVFWRDVNAPNAYTSKAADSPDDVVRPEFKRITGVSVNEDDSFDNAGGSFDSVVAKIIASETYPDIANSLPDIKGLKDRNVLYRLDEVVEKYCPNLYKYFGPESKVFGNEWKRQIKEYGGVYALPLSSSPAQISQMTKLDGNYSLTDEQIERVCGIPLSEYAYFYIRDDILKKIYPQAHSYDELQSILDKNGKFTESEIFDVPIETQQDFIDMLYKIKNLGLKENGKTVYPFYSHNGNDNWGALVTCSGLFGYGVEGEMGTGSYFTYWNDSEKKVKYTFKEEWFKNILKQWNQLVKDDVASKEALVDTNSNFNEKLKNGNYAVVWPYTDVTTINQSGMPFKYRKVYVKFKRNINDTAIFGADPTYLNKISIFNRNLNEQQLVQVLRAIDFAASDPGQKLNNWGTRASGLYTEDEQGNLQFTDEKLKDACLKADTDNLRWKYGILRAPFGISATKYNPAIYYERAKTIDNSFSAGKIYPVDIRYESGPDLYKDVALTSIKGFGDFWKARDLFETNMLKVFVSESDEQFESSYEALVKSAEEKGLTDENLETFNKLYTSEINPNIIDR